MKKENSEPPVDKNAGQAIFSFSKGLAVLSIITGYIIGPLIFVGGVGYLLDKLFNGRKIIWLSSIFIAFIISNVLVIKRSNKISERFTKNPKE